MMATTLTRSSAPIAERRARIGDVELFYLDAAGEVPLLMLHGLSANAHSFGAIITSGLTPAFHVIAPDLRGRARSSAPETGYSMADHARDVIGLMDHLGIEQAVIAGHSFGGYLAIYLAATFPNRFTRLIVLDAAITSHPRVGELIKPSLDRLGKTVPSQAAYLDSLKVAPYLAGVWDAHVEAYYRAELVENADGSAQSSTSASAIAQSAYGLACEPWLHLVQHTRQPALLVNALEAYGVPGTPPLMEPAWAKATAAAFPSCAYTVVPGNHITMLFGAGAVATAAKIEQFARAS
jgi:pimeloyl-ACP methyl ester carboxylesterase